MPEPLTDLAQRGLHHIDRELLVRRLLEALAHPTADALRPYLDPDVRFVVGGIGLMVTGHDDVIAACAALVGGASSVTLGIEFLTAAGDTVLVEERITLTYPSNIRTHTHGYSTFLFDGDRIVEWRQMWGTPDQ